MNYITLTPFLSTPNCIWNIQASIDGLPEVEIMFNVLLTQPCDHVRSFTPQQNLKTDRTVQVTVQQSVRHPETHEHQSEASQYLSLHWNRFWLNQIFISFWSDSCRILIDEGSSEVVPEFVAPEAITASLTPLTHYITITWSKNISDDQCWARCFKKVISYTY